MNDTEVVSFSVDTTNPQIDYDPGTEDNHTLSDAGSVYVDVSVTEVNEVAIIFTLFNST